MKTFSALILEKDKAFLSFAILKKGCLKLLDEKELALVSNDDFLKQLKTNAKKIEKLIIDFEQEHSLSVGKIFIELPPSLAGEAEVQEKIVFPKKKKITPSIIDSAKKYIENKFLEWNQHCIHHIVLDYQTEGIQTNNAPLQVFTNKIEFRSLLIHVKGDFYKEVADIFYNMEKNFAGFVAHKISHFSQGFNNLEGNKIVISVNNFNSYAGIKDEKGRLFEKEFSFGIKEIIEKLAKQYAVAPSIAKQLLKRYGSFKEIPYFKEITIKKQDSYLNLSTMALGNFLKKVFSSNIKLIIEEVLKVVKENKRDEVVFSFIGPLARKDGFYGYIKKLLIVKVEVPAYKCSSSAFGCIKYGYFKPLENKHLKKQSLLRKIKKIYHEYF
jgi:cell division ATPase FtsA